MKHLRRLLLVLLSITLPVYGWASIAVASPCPMQAGSATMKPGGTCCQDTDHAKSGNPCKAGQECQTGALYQPTIAAVLPVVPRSTVIATLPEPQLAAGDPAFVWRPPRPL